MNAVDGACRETVGILRALLFGADGACVELQFWALLAPILLFAGGVALLQFVVNRLFFGAPKDRAARAESRVEANLRRAAAHRARPPAADPEPDS